MWRAAQIIPSWWDINTRRLSKTSSSLVYRSLMRTWRTLYISQCINCAVVQWSDTATLNLLIDGPTNPLSPIVHRLIELKQYNPMGSNLKNKSSRVWSTYVMRTLVDAKVDGKLKHAIRRSIANATYSTRDDLHQADLLGSDVSRQIEAWRRLRKRGSI